ncbi:MAG TPA: hypothetical protein VGH22_12530, partial [Candidatus Binatia bacterium]
DLNFARPIHCFEWQNIYVYDFKTGEFQTKWVDQEEPVASAPQPNSVLLLLSSLLLIAALASAWWFRRRFFSPDANLL